MCVRGIQCVCTYVLTSTVVELLSLITGAFRSAEGLFPRNTADAQAVYDSVLRHYLLHVPLEFNPSWLQTTSASRLSQSSSHTVPHRPWMHSSTLPLYSEAPSTSRTSPVVQLAVRSAESGESVEYIVRPAGHMGYNVVSIMVYGKLSYFTV